MGIVSIAGTIHSNSRTLIRDALRTVAGIEPYHDDREAAEFLRGTVEEAAAWADANTIRGEFCIVVEGNASLDPVEAETWWEHLSIAEHIEAVMEKKNLSSKEAIKEVAKERGLPKRDVYQEYHV